MNEEVSVKLARKKKKKKKNRLSWPEIFNENVLKLLSKNFTILRILTESFRLKWR